MAKYLLSAHSVEGEARDPMTDEEMQRTYAQVMALQEEMESAGAWVFGGRLHEPATATVVRVSGGEVVTTDGPFVESKEHLGGFYIIEAEDLDAALALGVEDDRHHRGADRGPSVLGRTEGLTTVAHGQGRTIGRRFGDRPHLSSRVRPLGGHPDPRPR